MSLDSPRVGVRKFVALKQSGECTTGKLVKNPEMQEYMDSLNKLLQGRAPPDVLKERNIIHEIPRTKGTTPRPKTGTWSISFHRLLECETGVDFFKVFLSTEQKLPCLYFVEKVNHFEKAPASQLLALAKQITNTYILWDNTNSVPVSLALKDTIVTKYSETLSSGKAPSEFRWLFTPAKKEVLKYMEADLYPKFLKSAAFGAGVKCHGEDSSTSPVRKPVKEKPKLSVEISKLRPKTSKTSKTCNTTSNIGNRAMGMPKKINALAKRAFSSSPMQSPRTQTQVIIEPEIIPYDDVSSWRKSLISLMKSNNGVKKFSEFLISEQSIENLDFYREVNSFKKANPEERNILFEHIFQTYIAADAPLQVNLSGISQEKIHKWKKENEFDEKSERIVPENIFNEAQVEVFNLMRSDPYGRYIRSQMYKDILHQSKLNTQTDILEKADLPALDRSLLMQAKLDTPSPLMSEKSTDIEDSDALDGNSASSVRMPIIGNTAQKQDSEKAETQFVDVPQQRSASNSQSESSSALPNAAPRPPPRPSYQISSLSSSVSSSLSCESQRDES